MSLKSQSHYISPVTGKEVSKATYYRHVKKSQSQSHHFDQDKENEERELRRKAYKFGYEQAQKGIQSQSQSQKQDSADVAIKEILKDTYETGKKSHETVASEIEPGGTVAGSFFLCETEMELVTHVFNSFEKQYQNKAPDWVRMLHNLRGRLGI